VNSSEKKIFPLSNQGLPLTSFQIMREVRVRFAPSPTGALHIGGVSNGIVQLLLARKYGGTMILPH